MPNSCLPMPMLPFLVLLLWNRGSSVKASTQFYFTYSLSSNPSI
jgi:hypothetical protein